jgi:hypothetical protein
VIVLNWHNGPRDSYLHDLPATGVDDCLLQFFITELIFALDMLLRRAAQATPHVFSRPPFIQIGNSFRDFAAKQFSKIYKKLSQNIPARRRRSKPIRFPELRFTWRWATLLSFVLMMASGFAQQPGTLRDIKIIPIDSTVGEGTTYTISFIAPNGIDRNDIISIYFPIEFDIAGVLVANNVKKLNGGFKVNRDTTNGLRLVGLERDGFGVDLAKGDTGSFRIAIVGNPSQVKLQPYQIHIITQSNTDGSALDVGDGFVTLQAGAFDHFSFSPIGNNQTAGQNFVFTIFGKDALDNNVSVNDSIYFSDFTGTLTPKRVKMNNASLAVTAQITKTQNTVAITATALGKSGASNSFNVAPGSVASFALSNVPNPLTAGAPLALTITALDAFGNLVPAFTGPVYLKPDGEIKPDSTTGNFVNGVRNETIAYQKSGNNKQITVAQNRNGSGAAGSSNSFKVDPGKPSGTITFTVNPKAVLAGSNATTSIASAGSIKDALGNNVGAGKLFNVSVSDTALGLITTATPIATDFNSRLRFDFKAGSKGGAAIIFVSSVDGTASGNASVSVNQVRILAIDTTPITVSQGQRHIPVKMRVQNFGADSVSVDNVDLNFSSNAADYTVTPPALLPKIPGHGAIRTFNFFVDVAANAQTGAAIINGQISGALSSGVQYSDASADTTEAWTVQIPAQLRMALRASRATVTQGQTQPWKVTMTVFNDGQSAARIILNDDSTRTSLASAGHTVTPLSGTLLLAGESSKELDFVVTATSDTATSRQTIHGQVFAREINNDSLHFVDTFRNGSVPVTVQTPARLALDPIALFNVYNGDTVSVGQKFSIKVNVRQTAGTEKVDSVHVRLVNANGANALISKNVLTVGNDLAPALFFELTANNVAPKRAQFDASIVEAYSANTGANTVLFDGAAQSVTANIQRQGNLQFDKIAASEDTVRFARTAPWSITTDLVNPAPSDAGAVVIDSTAFTFKIGQNVQRDYTIEKVAADSVLYGGQKTTLLFNVTKTGTTSGTVAITATAYFHHRNSREKSSVGKTTTIVVESTALVTIAGTSFPPQVNRVAGTEIALVNTGQNFPINVTVRNTGFEKVESVVISLRSTAANNPSQILTPKVRLGPIDTETGTAVASFTVRAAAVANSSGEVFAARIDSAYTAAGLARLGQALAAKDTTAVVRIESPARLQLSLVTGDGATAFSNGQQFKVRARVRNLGQAQTDKSGRLRLIRPAGYNFAGTETDAKNFAAGDSVEWNIRAPLSESLQKIFTVHIDARPIDKNSGQPADTLNNAAALTVNTFDNALNIVDKFILAPAGARDRIISTDQVFTVAAKIQTSSNLTKKTVTLTLPNGSGYRLVNGDSATKNVVADTMRWLVQAPSVENLRPFKLPLEAKAFDGQQTVAARDTLAILSTEKQAILQIEPDIKPAGEAVSINQIFTIVAKLRNTGRAFADGTVEVVITAPPNMLQEPSLKKTAVFAPGVLIREMTWQAKAPSQPTQPNKPDTITFAITQRPRDVNTGLEALTSNDPAQLNITTVASGILIAEPPQITAPIGAKDRTVSTSQEFTVSDSLSWTNAANLTAELLVPPNANFTVSNPIQSVANANESGNAKVSWIVRAPAAPAANVKFRVRLRAIDAHDATLPLAYVSDSLAVNVIQRAELTLISAITEPASATRGVVSVGQPFRVVATLLNGGAASVYDSAKVRLSLPAGYSLVNQQEDAIKGVRLPDQNSFSWWVRARPDVSEIADLIKFNLTQPPRDGNTDAFAAVSDDETELAVRAEGRKMIVENLGQGGGPAVHGGKNILLARLKLTNPARPGSSNLALKQLSFDLMNRAGKALAPNAVLKAVHVIHEKGANNIQSDDNKTSLANNPLVVNLSTPVSVSADKPDTIAIVADLAENTAEPNFRLVFDDSQDFSVDDWAGGSGVVVETPDGKRGNKFRLETNLTALLGADPQSAFFNYPNPLQPGNDQSDGQGTLFNVPAGASGELKIFTLLGELVWEADLESRRQLGTNGVFWNGHNGVGQRVLNGVYVAMLKTKDGKMLTTKVAVLKK